MPDELGTEVRDIVQETGIKTIPMEKKCKKAKWLSEEALQMAVLRNLYAGQKATVRTGHGTTDWFQIGKGVCQGCYPAYLTSMQSTS